MVGFGAFDSEKLVSFFQDNLKQKQNESRFCCFTLRDVGVNQN